jgi:hypothetical protein
MQKPYHKILWDESKPVSIFDGELVRTFSLSQQICRLTWHIVQLEYFERDGEDNMYSNAYLAGGSKMEKKRIIA